VKLNIYILKNTGSVYIDILITGLEIKLDIPIHVLNIRPEYFSCRWSLPSVVRTGSLPLFRVSKLSS
jgi:hypothetical protein